MNSYLFTSWATRTEIHRENGRARNYDTIASLDVCSSLIVCGENFEAAQNQYEKWLGSSWDSAKPVSVKIQKIFAAPMMEYLFAESGPQPMDWPRISEEIMALADSTPLDDFEQGYWLDVNETVRSGASIDHLRESLPEDVRSDLNWSADKQFLFLLTVFSLPTPPRDPLDDPEEKISASEQSEENTSSEPSASELREQQTIYPQLAEKEVAAIIRARNSAVAASLWRNYAATTPLAANSIRIDPPCGVIWPTDDAAKAD